MDRQSSRAGAAASLQVEAVPGLPGPREAAAPARPAARRKPAPRPVPVRNEQYDHLSLDELRALRRTLADEEGKVSYWRRILQARLDVLQADGPGKHLDSERLRPVLTTQRVGAGRQALVEVLPVDDIPPLPRLDQLWERRVAPGDEQGRLELEQDLRAAEAELSAYRSALHARIGDTTVELIARYREQPGLCLSALPLDPSRRASA